MIWLINSFISSYHRSYCSVHFISFFSCESSSLLISQIFLVVFWFLRPLKRILTDLEKRFCLVSFFPQIFHHFPREVITYWLLCGQLILCLDLSFVIKKQYLGFDLDPSEFVSKEKETNFLFPIKLFRLRVSYGFTH